MADAVYYYNPRGFRRQKQSSFGVLKFLSSLIFIIATLITIITIGFNVIHTSQSAKIVSPLPQKPNKGILSAFVENVREALPRNNERLAQTVTRSMEGTKGTYAIAIKNLETGEEYYQNENQKFDSASLYKLWVMGTVYSQIQEGTLKLDQPLEADVAKINDIYDIDPEFAELTDGVIDFTIQSALEQMITISHNYAALSLATTVKNSNMKNFLSTYHMDQTTTNVPPQTTAHDIMLFYEQLYNGKIVNPEASADMIELLKRQKINDRIPKYLPEETPVAHKTGELGGVKHDAGIVYSPKGDYIIVVMSKSDSPDAAAERIALLSKAVYDYFNK
jgi:beta-lactamase class A